MNKTKIIHISIIIIGIIFVAISSFHENLWFDESYSVAISENYSFDEIWEIGSHDVHPVLYYWLLRIVCLFTGNSIIALRLFSVLALVILGIIGYTHIRKDFGEKAGLVFSFLVFFIPTNVIYASEIRMYTWGMLFVTIMSIYGYRIFLGSGKYKNWIIFAIFSLASAYTHYYGLMAAGIVNILLLLSLIINAIKQKKWTSDLTKFIVQGVIQVGLYLPWVVSLFTQMKQVESGFWIQKKALFDISYDIFLFQFTGNLDANEYISNSIGLFYGIIVIAIITYLLGKNRDKLKKNISVPIISTIIYIVVIVGAAIVSEKMNRSILYPRYMLITTGLLTIATCYILGKFGSKKTIALLFITTFCVSLSININLIKINYDESNKVPFTYIEENYKEGDIFVYKSVGSGFIISAMYPEYNTIFYNEEKWGVEEAYKAFGHNYKTANDLEFLNDYSGRIWIIDDDNYSFTNDIIKNYENIKMIKQDNFETQYKDYKYTFSIMQKGV